MDNTSAGEIPESITPSLDKKQIRLQKRRENYRKRNQDPEYKKMLKEKNAVYRADPKTKEKELTYYLKRKEDPHYLQKRKECRDKLRAAPSYREKDNQYRREYYHKNKEDPEFIKKKKELAAAFSQKRRERKVTDPGYREACLVKERIYDAKNQIKRRKTLSMSFVLKAIGEARRRFRKKSKTDIAFGFDLDTEEVRNELFQRLLVGKCEVTSILWNMNSESWRPSLDRIDNSKGYTLDNIQWVVWMYNRAKGSGPDDDVMIMAMALAKQNTDNSQVIEPPSCG